MHVLTTPIPKDCENATVDQIRRRNKLHIDDYVYKGLILNEHNNSFRYNDNKGKRKHQDTKANPNKKSKVTCWKCKKHRHLKKDCKGRKVGNNANGSGTNDSSNSLKGQNMFNKSFQDDPNTFDEVMKSQDVAFWKEANNNKMDPIIGNNTWVLAYLPLGYKPLGLKWIFKRKLNVDVTIKNFKARLVIQGIRQKSRIDNFNTYAPVAHISTIRLLIALASIHNLIIYQVDMKTTFLNNELDEDVYMNQPQDFILPGNENK
nr:zinc finger, CCHC-type [Tanacetum cinerariifolium]